uniref:CYTH domain-containing protein n=1 Tax=Trichuris muris TaxID=70415 RepID=A0A5S6Q6K7_TRIMR
MDQQQVTSTINGHVSVNVELKIAVRDYEAMQKQLFDLFGSMGTVYREVDHIYNATIGYLMLRTIDDAPSGILMAYERTPSSASEQHVPMVTEYRWAEVPNIDSTKAVLSNSLEEMGIIRKRRSVLTSGKYLVHLDEVEEVGIYAEIIYRLEPGEPIGQGLRVLDDLMRRMQLDPTLISGMSYHDLLLVRRVEAEEKVDDNIKLERALGVCTE